MSPPRHPLNFLPEIRQQVFNRFLRWFAPVALLIISGGLSVAVLAIRERTGEISVPERINVDLAWSFLNDEVKRPLTHLSSLALHEPTAQRVIDGKENLPALAETFSTLLLRNPEYAQMRWIGDDGMERVRIDRARGGGIREVPPQELQDKHGRYYVSDTLGLSRGEIFISPLDLNIEHNQIEVPFNPMIRLGTRVFGTDGMSAGMFILNISAQTMLDKFARHGHGSNLMLLNPEGYWLKSPSPEDEWGFMLDKTETFGRRYPAAWRDIAATEKGQAETPSGLWTWQTVHVSADGSRQASPVFWKVISYVPATTLSAGRRTISMVIASGGAAILLVFGIGIWRLARETEARLWAEEGLLHEKAFLNAANDQLNREAAFRKEVQDQLERSNRNLDEFAYIASHDLKEPLRGIHNYASFLQEDYAEKLDDEGRNHLQRIQRLAERQTALLERLLAYSRIGHDDLPQAPADLDALLDEVAKDLEPFLAEAGVELRRTGKLPTVACNAIRVGEVFQNLIVNAVKYNDKPQKWVEVGCGGTADLPVIHVRDNGIGIAPQHQDAVFRIFKRLHEHSKYGGGTGAGLTIVKKIIERHGGRIWLESAPGAGTTFYFTLSGAR